MMTKTTLQRLFIFAASILTGPGLVGQSAAVSEAVLERFAAVESPMRFEFRVYPQFPSDIPNDAFFYTLEEGEVQRVELSFFATQPSERYRYRGPSPLRIFAESETSGVTRIARVPIGTDAQPSLLVFLSDAEGSGYRVVALPEEPDGFREGTIRFLNLTTDAIFGQIGEQRLRIDSGSEEIFPVRAGAEALDVRVQLAQFDAGDPKLIYSSVWPVDRRRRSTVFLLPSQNPGRGAVTFRSFAEMPPEPEAEEEGRE